MAIRTVLRKVADDKLCIMKICVTIRAEIEFHFITGRILVTIVAADKFMFTDKWKFCSAMIKGSIINLLEACGLMTA